MKKKENTANVPATTTGSKLPAKKASPAAMMAQDAKSRSGFENMGADDMAIPFLVVLQALSPQLRGPTKIKNAKEGDFLNTVTQDLYPGEARLVPCAYQKAWVEWTPRESGGGFVRQHMTDDILAKCIKDVHNRDVVQSSGHVIVQTAYHYCLLIKPSGVAERVVVALTSTQLKKSRRWNSQMQSLVVEDENGQKFTPPMYSHIYEVASVEESNDRGQWAGWEFSNPSLIEDVDLYLLAKKFHDEVSKGGVKVAPPPEDFDGGATPPPASRPRQEQATSSSADDDDNQF